MEWEAHHNEEKIKIVKGVNAIFLLILFLIVFGDEV